MRFWMSLGLAIGVFAKSTAEQPIGVDLSKPAGAGTCESRELARSIAPLGQSQRWREDAVAARAGEEQAVAARGRSTPFAQQTAAISPATLDAYFRLETARLRQTALEPYETAEQWSQARPILRQQLLSMLGLDPLPEKTDLRAKVTGVHERDGVRVENILFQSSPGLYVTGNLYLPVEHEGQLPAILYVCGHGGVKKNGVSYGNKVHYQHHGAWFARHGYVCLTIDTLQLGEIEGDSSRHVSLRHVVVVEPRLHAGRRRGLELHPGAGLSASRGRKSIRERIGVTGRSGGGAYSWWIAAHRRTDSRRPCRWRASPTCRTTSSTAASKATATACTWSTRTAGTIRWWPRWSRRGRC